MNAAKAVRSLPKRIHPRCVVLGAAVALLGSAQEKCKRRRRGSRATRQLPPQSPETMTAWLVYGRNDI